MIESVEIFPWNHNFETGIPEIDEQHKRLIELLNQLVSHLAFQSDVPALNSIFEQLKDYTVFHFQREETIWRSFFSDDSWVTGHTQAHAHFVDEVLRLKGGEGLKDFDDVIEEIVSFLTNWLALHIIESDKRLAQVVLAMRSGAELKEAKQVANEYMSGAARAMIETVLSMYDKLASRTVQLTREIARRKKAEAEKLELERQMLQAQKLESLGVMAGGVAHDYNNILQVMMGNMEMALKAVSPDSEPHAFLTSGLISGRHATHLTGLLLNYVGSGFMAKKPLNLNDLVRESADMLRMAATHNVSVDLSLSAVLPPVMADEAQLRQVVMNLVTNAAEAIVEPPGFVRIATGSQFCDQAALAASLLPDIPQPGRFVFLEVRDNGCGMNEETVARIFDPFYTTKFTGRGLGMSAVMGIVRTHDGAIFLESRPGSGSTFRVLFPVSSAAQPAAAEEPVPPLPSADLPEPRLSGLALVVDDERPVLKICARMVSLCGFTVITASDGIDAVSKFRDNAADIAVVLMDLTMPNMDGITAMSEIYSIRPDARVIIASGYNKEDLGRQLTGQAPAGFIRKPYGMGVLEAELTRVMGARPLSR